MLKNSKSQTMNIMNMNYRRMNNKMRAHRKIIKKICKMIKKKV